MRDLVTWVSFFFFFFFTCYRRVALASGRRQTRGGGKERDVEKRRWFGAAFLFSGWCLSFYFSSLYDGGGGALFSLFDALIGWGS